MIDGSYTLSDFLLFSQDTYFRLFGLYNRDVWPLQAAALGIAALLLAMMRRPTAARPALLILALVWIWAGLAFHIQRYATINFAATFFGVLFFVEAAVLAVMAFRWRPRFTQSRAAVALVVFGVFVNPLIGFAAGRNWTELSFFGLGPDPTAIVTVGVLFACRPRWIALSGAMLWCLIAVLTALAMESVEVIGPALGLLTAPLVHLVRYVRGRDVTSEGRSEI